ncbi:uncharacterized protein KY384_008799 [Bacidia gigantensis]|uniref:uncharacterized protein n=1 Tax=Bacidia gigantensis TaxID=2732470 RepID=UPI001D03B75E|nr:uncharacterized protein KY384_008799 [Bacidia gigantensis]KAG8526598.1 hypothetical protein KY384_008799 [Bacidia gigantensis]
MASRSFCSNDIQLNSVIDTIRLFLDCVDFSDSSCDGWNVAMNFACHFNGKSNDYAKIYILFEWIIIQFQQEMKDNPNPGIYASMSNYVCRAEDPNALQLWRDLAPQSAFKQKGRYEFQILAPQLVGESSEIAHFLSRGADASCAGINEDISPRPETLTSLAMYSIQAFQNWTGNISEARIDIDAVLAHESKEGPVHEAGWTLETLQKLYEFSEVNCACGDSYDCCICKKKIGQNGLKIQPLWLYAQEKIKCGNLPQRKTFRDFFEEARAESSGEMSKNLEERSEEEDGEDFTEELDDSSIDIEEAEAFLSDLDKRYEERLSKKLPTGLLVLGRWPEAALDPMDLETARSKPVEEWPSYAYRRSDRVRMQCWLAHPHLHMGNWKKVAVTSESDTDAYTGMSSQDEFSPYLIHS